MDCSLIHDEPVGRDGSFGTLYRDDTGEEIACTLERSYSDGEGGWYAKIPPGRYFCTLGMHPINGLTYEVTGVLGHTAILFHVGNWEKDSAGCILLGKDVAPSTEGKMLLHSREAFTAFMVLQNGTPSFWLRVDQATA